MANPCRAEGVALAAGGDAAAACRGEQDKVRRRMRLRLG
eukprot:CAMPEP_0179248198 /NCGR_PEP_ID=MMETSP0797-20121207/20003_1 /TAXON_ID=47934 /ORGANISM="Dinophysis acuminata, Strain DAEP01" /LENGTH=38 /DNA_ID= /DNA_START= /DNA_END= /DNA_ORIENTATION=